MMKPRKVSNRTCIACRSSDEKRWFVRIVRTPDGHVVVDPIGEGERAGAYLCAKPECFDVSRQRRRLDSALKVNLRDDDYDRLRRDFEKLLGTAPDEAAGTSDAMPAMRVHELAKEFGMTSKELLDKLQELKIPAKNHASTLVEAYVDKIRKALGPEIAERQASMAEENAKARPRPRAKRIAEEVERKAAEDVRRKAAEDERVVARKSRHARPRSPVSVPPMRPPARFRSSARRRPRGRAKA